MVCGCCGAAGKTKTGCSCTGGKTHVCLKALQPTASTMAAMTQEKPKDAKSKKAENAMLEGIFVMQKAIEEREKADEPVLSRNY